MCASSHAKALLRHAVKHSFLATALIGNPKGNRYSIAVCLETLLLDLDSHRIGFP